MKITIDRNGDDVHVTVEREPMPKKRFKAMCSLAGAAIFGGAFLGAIALVGFWAIPWGVCALIVVLAGVGLIQIV